MICEKCNREIGPEELTCPYCGHENPFAAKHSQNMKQFKRTYQKTKDEVLDSAKNTSELAKKAAILIVLVIGCIIMSVISSYNYSDHDPDEEIRRDAEKNAAIYVSQAQDYLKRGEYTEYMSFLYAHELQNFPPQEFDHLRHVNYVVSEYYECIRHMEEIVLRSDDPEYFDGLDSDIKIFCMYANGFYEVYEVQKEGEKNKEYLACIEDMKTELEAAMRTYFSMNDDELREFIAASEAQKAVKLEEIFRHE